MLWGGEMQRDEALLLEEAIPILEAQNKGWKPNWKAGCLGKREHPGLDALHLHQKLGLVTNTYNLNARDGGRQIRGALWPASVGVM